MKTHPSDSDNIPSIVINIFPYNKTFVIRSPWNDQFFGLNFIFYGLIHIAHELWVPYFMAYDKDPDGEI